jgi:NAD(P)-dependent dehydrogenase (short-subunit alcohol dehydrogenase family)
LAKVVKLRDKRVVVLGGTSGIGLAVAQAAIEEGASVTVASHRSDAVERARSELTKGSAPPVAAHVVDVTSEDAIRAFLEGVGSFDHLAYTAGDDLPLGPLLATDLPKARGRFEIRYWGAVAAVKHGAPLIREGGSIVLTSGFSATRPRPGWTSQASIQSAIEGLTRALAVELGPIRVNAVSPGVSRTPRWNAWTEEDRKAFYEGEVRRLPVRRVGEAADIAAAFLYFMTNPYATGNVLNVDGGGALV